MLNVTKSKIDEVDSNMAYNELKSCWQINFTKAEVSAELRLPYCIIMMDNRINEINISQPIQACWLHSGNLLIELSK